MPAENFARRIEGRNGSTLVARHQAGIARDVRGENRRQSLLDS
jgi:hypothetical protein